MAKSGRERALDAAVLAIAAIDLVLLVLAVRLGAAEVSDGAGRVTTGTNVALSILASVLGALLLQRVRVSPRLRRWMQLFALAGIAVHAIGHLARLYYDFWWYDEVLHMAIPGFAAVLAVRLAQEARLFPARHATPARAGALAALIAVALAGVWEIFEFTMDVLLSTREQDDLADTMTDMIDGLVGALGAAAWCWQFPRPPKGLRG